MSKINAVKASVEIVDPNLDPTTKVANMARICYRSESAAGPEADKRLIGNCIKKGHTSVMEHSHMSVVFSDEVKKMQDLLPDWATEDMEEAVKNKPIDVFTLWTSVNSLDVRRYLFVWKDDGLIIDKLDPEWRKNNPNTFASVDVVCGNLRAWLNIESDVFDAAIISNEVVLVGMIASLIKASLDAYPSVFCNLVDAINARLPKIIIEDSKLGKKLGDKLATVTFDDIYELCGGSKHNVVAAPSTNRVALSAVLTTERAVTHELVRHRADASYSQESQRWVNYNNKGFTFIRPSLDPVKYEKAEFAVDSAELLPGVGVLKSKLEDGGYIPKDTAMYKFWERKMEDVVSTYEIFSQFDINGEEKLFGSVPPEFCRGCLPNWSATTIGVTFTPQNFTNLMHWRLGADAYWPIRNLLGTMIVDALKQDHPFFSNFHPVVILRWLKKIEDQKICTDKELLEKLVKAQDERLTSIRKRREERAAEAAKQAEEFERATGRVEQKVAEAAKAMTAQ